jgi:hypothetical protein
VRIVGKCEIFVNVTCLQKDKRQDDGSRNVSLRVLLLVIMNSCVWQAKMSRGVNCNTSTHCVQNISFTELFKNERVLIQSVSLLYCMLGLILKTLHDMWEGAK